MGMTQEEHDRAHPGKVCRTCPRQLEFMRHLTEVRDYVRLPWYRRIFRKEPRW